ncbi:MAG: 6-carboxytetrahydropterin synthase [Planctomycetota bacterium]|nr:6-carboxytetrahydropterin synthase [Planctomycetota bacterium]
MPVADIVHLEEFAAAHRLHARDLGVQENAETYGACQNIHGHNYVLEVTVRGEVDARTGMVMNLVDLRSAMREEIVDQVDHRFLNEDVSFLQDLPVITTENLAIAFWSRLAAREAGWGGPKLHRVRLMESQSNIVDYYGE